MKTTLYKYILLVIGVSVLFLASTAQAVTNPGVTVTVYNNNTYNNLYNNAPPIPPTTPIAGVTTLPMVDHNYDQAPLFDLYEDFVVRYDGYITPSFTGQTRFYAPGDDGVRLILNDTTIINDWRDKGGGGTISPYVQVQEGQPIPFTLWYYENGGGAWVQLYWQINNSLQTVPPSAFSTIGSWINTTTTSSETPTSEPTTTEIPTSSSLTLSTTTTTQPTLPTTTSTTTVPPLTTLTVLTLTSTSTTTTTSSLAPSSSISPTLTTASTVKTTTTTIGVPLTPTVTISTQTSLENSVVPSSDPPIPTSAPEPPSPEEVKLNRVYKKKVSFGPIHLTLTVTGRQRRTVVAAAIVQITTIASMSVPGGTSSGVTTRRKR